MENKTNIINKSDIQKAIHMNGFFGKVIASLIMKVLELNKANSYHHRLSNYKGHEFSQQVLKELDIKYDIKSEQLDYIPAEGPFITISNHHFGGVDGLLLSTVIGQARPDFKILTNFILSMIPSLKEVFFPVNPFSDNTSSRSSFTGLKMALQHIQDGGALGLFPAGEVATIQNWKNKTTRHLVYVEDKPWPDNIIRMIKNCSVPVVPVYFDGVNSKTFHILGKIHPRLRTIRLVHELFNKRHSTIPMRIGKPISPSELNEFTSTEELKNYLRSRVYIMQSEFVRQYKKPAKPIAQIGEPIALPQDKRLIFKELADNTDKILYKALKYECYLLNYDDVPNTMLELGRLREETFRAVGEGTNTSRDLSEYDKYYKHLILWDTEERKIVGAYRLGIGSEIWPKKGIKGFYTAKLFDYQAGASEILPETIELGRSFIARQYQKEPLSLLMLFKGLMYSLLKYPEIKYFLGPVSISNEIPRIYKSLLIYFLYNGKSCTYPKKIAVQTCPFRTEFNKIRPEHLLSHKMDSVEKIDRFILNLSDGQWRMPPLVKKYFKSGAQLICYNIDPNFNYSLDGLILLPIATFPKEELLNMLKSASSEEEKAMVLNRFGYSAE